MSDSVTLRPGDVIRVAIWREEDLSGDFPVNERGVVVLPLLGEQNVTGTPLERLREVLIERYRAQLRNPSIQITPLRRVMVLGEVAKPGLQEVDPTITLAGAIALAGGPTSNGDMRRIRVVRNGAVLRERAAMETQLSSMDIRSGDQIFVGRRGWVERNSAVLVSSAISATLFLATLFISRSGDSGDSDPEHEPKSPTGL
ncbi:MAG TPA: polysaccharide biosynthesis/export family protein [Longimicrobiaceae bacterium]|nr:polysaccharide biosynthesis/export family protein [Longimicrobiaceae bacterium]